MEQKYATYWMDTHDNSITKVGPMGPNPLLRQNGHALAKIVRSREKISFSRSNGPRWRRIILRAIEDLSSGPIQMPKSFFILFIKIDISKVKNKSYPLLACVV